MEDITLENLLLLDGETFIVDEEIRVWVKFEVKIITPSLKRPKGIRYSLTLHDKNNKRILGFDNAHSVKRKDNNSTYLCDHWHKDESDEGRPYRYQNAAKLLEDFWAVVEKKIKLLKGE